jgi:hypothetical protein
MPEYGFTQKEIQNYESLKQVYSSWGRDVENDYLKLCVYDLVGNLLQEKILGLDSVSLENDGDFIDLKIGQHLRDCGYTEGEYDVEYRFLRRLAGREQIVYVDDTGKVYNRKIETKEINGETRFFTYIGEDKDTTTRKEVFPRELKYIGSEISPDRTEMILELDSQVKNSEYKVNLSEMGELIEYQPQGSIKFDSKEPHILEFEINPNERGFTQNMVGGELIIPDLYKVTGFEDTDNSDLPDNDSDNEFDFVDAYELDNEVPTYTNEELIEILNGEESTEEEKFYADQALQDRAYDRR